MSLRPTSAPWAAIPERCASPSRAFAYALVAVVAVACTELPSAPADALVPLGVTAGGIRRATRVCVPGKCDDRGIVNVIAIVPQAESEPNNLLSVADSLGVRTTVGAGPVAAVSARLASSADIDVFWVHLPPAPLARRYDAELVAQRADPGSGLTATLEHVGSPQSEVADRVLQTSDSCAQPASVDPCLSFSVPAGAASTRVHLRVKSRGNASGRYTLILSQR